MDNFEWDKNKNIDNKSKHNVDFIDAQSVFLDKNRIIYEDISHSTKEEKRYFCIGKLENKVCTVRFTFRKSTKGIIKIRIFGAGYWRKERKIYEKNKK